MSAPTVTDHPSALVSVPEPMIEAFRDWYALHFGRPIMKGKARKIVGRILSAAPAAPQAAGVGERVRAACAVFQEAIDYFEADVADVMSEGSERADLWDREVTVNIDALKAVMNAALRAPSREPEGGAVAVKPLDWRKPSEFDRDNGHENAEQIAPGLGGAYAIQRDLANFILWRIDDPFAFDTFPTMEAAKAHAEADWQRTMSRKVTALATREEAPAEAGSFEERAIALVKKYGNPNGSDYEQGQNDMGHRMVTMAREADAALRAQPQAREDAQPVAWAMPGVLVSMKAEGLSGDIMPVADDEFTQPLFTHPAPDALRVAVEASGFLLDRLEDLEQDVNERDFYGHVHPAASRLRLAIAALQAEQKGGA